MKLLVEMKFFKIKEYDFTSVEIVRNFITFVYSTYFYLDVVFSKKTPSSSNVKKCFHSNNLVECLYDSVFEYLPVAGDNAIN